MKLSSDKSKLERLSEVQQNALETELESLSEKGKQLAVNSLFIIGGLALAYFLFRAVTDDGNTKPNKKGKQDGSEIDTEPSLLSNITQSIAKEAAIALLALAKDKLSDYLNKGTTSDEDTSRTH